MTYEASILETCVALKNTDKTFSSGTLFRDGSGHFITAQWAVSKTLWQITLTETVSWWSGSLDFYLLFAELALYTACAWRARKLHFQLQVTIGSYGYEPLELYLVHGVLAFLALVVVHCILTEAKAVMVWLWVLFRSPSMTL